MLTWNVLPYPLSQMLKLLSTQPLFLLRSGRLTHLHEGCFIQSFTEQAGNHVGGVQMGRAARDFVERELPLFNIPLNVKVTVIYTLFQDIMHITEHYLHPALHLKTIPFHYSRLHWK